MTRAPDRREPLRSYVLAKHAAADLVRDVRAFFQAAGAERAVEGAQELLVRLAEDRFNLAVVGQFKRGKSTLINAIVGRDVLPTGVLPLTSAITSLHYGPRERALLTRAGWARPQEVPLDQLADFVTERGNPGNERGLVEAAVEIPSRFLRRGLWFVDTPGMGASSANDSTTRAFLPQADAVIFVTSVEGPLGEAEAPFLSSLAERGLRLFLVVNKIDTLEPADRPELVEYVETRARELLRGMPQAVLAVSARDALRARVKGDAEGIASSGLSDLEQGLAAFLAHQQGRIFLDGILAGTARMLRVEGGDARASEIDQRWHVLLETVEATRERLRAGLALGAVEAPTSRPASDQMSDRRLLRRTPASVRRPSTRTTSGCAVCDVQAEAIFQLFVHVQYVLSSDANARREFADLGGFCPAHTWQFQQFASPQTLSTAYPLLIDRAGDALRTVEPNTTAHSSPTRKACPACAELATSARSAVDDLLRKLAPHHARQGAGRAPVLCLPHLAIALQRASEETRELLVSAETRLLEETAEDMRSYALKRDAVRRGLMNAHEERAWRRGLVYLVGARAVAAPAAEMQDEL